MNVQCIRVELVLKDIGHKKCGLSRQVVFDDRFDCSEMWDLMPGISGNSRQVVSHSSGLSRQVSLYCISEVSLHIILPHRYGLLSARPCCEERRLSSASGRVTASGQRHTGGYIATTGQPSNFGGTVRVRVAITSKLRTTENKDTSHCIFI